MALVAALFSLAAYGQAPKEMPSLPNAHLNAASLATAASKGDKAALLQLTVLAMQGHSSAQFNLGSIYDFGDGTPQDPIQALGWYTKAAEQGDGDAEFSLGRMYRYGRGIPKDFSKALVWFTKSAEHGNANGQGALGLIYEEDNGLQKDYVAAYMWQLTGQSSVHER
jgi:TPR repeat protein